MAALKIKNRPAEQTTTAAAEAPSLIKERRQAELREHAHAAAQLMRDGRAAMADVAKQMIYDAQKAKGLAVSLDELLEIAAETSLEAVATCCDTWGGILQAKGNELRVLYAYRRQRGMKVEFPVMEYLGA